MKKSDVKLALSLQGEDLVYKWISVEQEKNDNTSPVKIAMDRYRHLIQKIIIDYWNQKDWMAEFEYAGEYVKEGTMRVTEDGKTQYAVLVTLGESLVSWTERKQLIYERHGPYWVTANSLTEASKIVVDRLFSGKSSIDEQWKMIEDQIVDMELEKV